MNVTITYLEAGSNTVRSRFLTATLTLIMTGSYLSVAVIVLPYLLYQTRVRSVKIHSDKQYLNLMEIRLQASLIFLYISNTDIIEYSIICNLHSIPYLPNKQLITCFFMICIHNCESVIKSHFTISCDPCTRTIYVLTYPRI